MKNSRIVWIMALVIAASCATKSPSGQTTSIADEQNLVPIGDTVDLPSGLSYKIINRGVGRAPKSSSKVRVHYEGTLNNGTVFDSSIERGKPLVFKLNEVIPGWQEGLLLMREGALYELYIPAKLGYGSRAAGKIPPFSNLKFRVELLEVL